MNASCRSYKLFQHIPAILVITRRYRLRWDSNLDVRGLKETFSATPPSDHMDTTHSRFLFYHFVERSTKQSERTWTAKTVSHRSLSSLR
eukprot:IDg5989t1